MFSHVQVKCAIFIFATAIFATNCLAERRQSYTGYSLYRCTPRTTYQVDKLRSFMSEKRDGGIEFWTEPASANRTVDIMASPAEEDLLRDFLKVHRISAQKIMHDVGDVIRRTSNVFHDEQTSRSQNDDNEVNSTNRNLLDAQLFYQKFPTYPEIEAKLVELAKDPRITFETIGQTYEKRNLYLVKVSTDPSANKPVIFLDAGHHAREWISHTTLLYLLESLVNDDMPRLGSPTLNASTLMDEKGSFSGSLRSKLDRYDFWFVPVMNPDGYVYSYTTDRLWRKNRSRQSFCFGADPNRNYDFHWRESGASTFACSLIYAGPYANSELEVKALSKVLYTNRKRIEMYLSLHAYSQLILLPYGYARVYPDNSDEMNRVAEAGARGIASVRGTSFSYGPSAIVLYPAAGGSDDYAHGHCNIRFAYTIELPDTGTNGFLMPPEEIIAIGQESAVGIAAMIDAK